MKLNDILKTETDIKLDENSISNNLLTGVDIDIIAHFGNCACLEVCCENVVPISTYNNTQNLGFLIRALVVLLGLEKEDGIRFSKIKNIPVRLIFEGNGGWGSKCIGFGHFMEDRFVYTADFVKIDE